MELKIGPAANTKYFLADAPAVYRYCLSGAQIKSHYESTIINNSVQVVSGSFGELFKSTIQHQNSPDKFMYPVQKNWEYFLNDLRGSVPNVNSVEVTKDLTDLFFRKGQLAIMANVLNLEAQLESVIEERNNPQDNDQEEAA